MKQLIKKISAYVAVFALVAVTALVPTVSVSAACTKGTTGTPTAQQGLECARGEKTPGDLFGAGGIFTTIVNTLLFVIGAVSVIMLIWGGIRYTTSAGNSASVTSAKNTIMYAIIGLVIAFLAYAIINWVVAALSK